MVRERQITVGVDLGGTSIRVGFYDHAMQLIDSRAMPTRVTAGPQSCVEEIAESIRLLLRRFDLLCSSYEVLGVGLGSPGPLNLRTGVLGLLPNLAGWENFPLRDALAEATGFPVILESDANAAAIAEWKLGAGRAQELDSMAMITLGTGVGSGLILHGRVWHGMFGMGGEAGHTTVDPQGLLCGCGSRGCLEMYASANGLLRIARRVADSGQGTVALQALVERPEGFTTRDVADLALKENDSAAQLAFERLGSYLGIGLANLINTLDLPMIVIGGGVASAWRLFAPAMFESVREYSVIYRLVAPLQRQTREQDRTFICPAVLGSQAGLLGAGLLPRLAVFDAASANTNFVSEISQ